MSFIYFKVSDKKKSEREVQNFQENLENLCCNFISIDLRITFVFIYNPKNKFVLNIEHSVY